MEVIDFICLAGFFKLNYQVFFCLFSGGVVTYFLGIKQIDGTWILLGFEGY